MAAEKTQLAPLGQAASDLAALCNAIDDGVELNDDLLEKFGEAKLTHEAAVARRINFLHALEHGYAECANQVAEWNARKGSIENALDFFVAKTKQAILDNPGIPYKSRSGELKVVNNGGVKPLEITGFRVNRLNYSNVITDEMCVAYSIPAKYLKRDVIVFLNTELIRADLDKGTVLEWATLNERGTRLKY